MIFTKGRFKAQAIDPEYTYDVAQVLLLFYGLWFVYIILISFIFPETQVFGEIVGCAFTFGGKT